MIARISVIQLATQFLERCSTLNAAACADNFKELVRQIGFAKSACGAWAGVGRNRKHRFFFIDWPHSWLELYEKNDFFQHDPVAIEARRRVGSFWYSSVSSRQAAPEQKRIYDAFVAFGWKDCFAVPIHGPGSLQGLVTMTTRKELGLGDAERAALEIVARIVWERCRTSEGFGLAGAERPHLSLREVECLQWAAGGKTDREIAALLGIKPVTARFHIEGAKRRFGVRTRVEAVAMGVLHGLI